MLVVLSCPTLWGPMNYKPPGTSVHGIFQDIEYGQPMEWVAIPFSSGFSDPGIKPTLRADLPTESPKKPLVVVGFTQISRKQPKPR